MGVENKSLDHRMGLGWPISSPLALTPVLETVKILSLYFILSNNTRIDNELSFVSHPSDSLFGIFISDVVLQNILFCDWICLMDFGQVSDFFIFPFREWEVAQVALKFSIYINILSSTSWRSLLCKVKSTQKRARRHSGCFGLGPGFHFFCFRILSFPMILGENFTNSSRSGSDVNCLRISSFLSLIESYKFLEI